MDRLTKDQRRKTMQAIKGKDSKIELKLAKALWAKGLRYRKNYSKLIGKPDIVFVSSKVAVFCDSEFWHGKNWDVNECEVKSNIEFWQNKIKKNIERDRKVNKILVDAGWKVLRFWGKEIERKTEKCACEVEKAIKRRNSHKEE